MCAFGERDENKCSNASIHREGCIQLHVEIRRSVLVDVCACICVCLYFQICNDKIQQHSFEDFISLFLVLLQAIMSFFFLY